MEDSEIKQSSAEILEYGALIETKDFEAVQKEQDRKVEEEAQRLEQQIKDTDPSQKELTVSDDDFDKSN